jgi:hypothetical protein
MMIAGRSDDRINQLETWLLRTLTKFKETEPDVTPAEMEAALARVLPSTILRKVTTETPPDLH